MRKIVKRLRKFCIILLVSFIGFCLLYILDLNINISENVQNDKYDLIFEWHIEQNHVKNFLRFVTPTLQERPISSWERISFYIKNRSDKEIVLYYPTHAPLWRTYPLSVYSMTLPDSSDNSYPESELRLAGFCVRNYKSELIKCIQEKIISSDDFLTLNSGSKVLIYGAYPHFSLSNKSSLLYCEYEVPEEIKEINPKAWTGIVWSNVIKYDNRYLNDVVLEPYAFLIKLSIYGIILFFVIKEILNIFIGRQRKQDMLRTTI